jgi:hypothetical protein
MMQTETETHLMTIRTNESNIERQKTEIVSLYSQIQQLQGMSGINSSDYLIFVMVYEYIFRVYKCSWSSMGMS